MTGAARGRLLAAFLYLLASGFIPAMMMGDLIGLVGFFTLVLAASAVWTRVEIVWNRRG